MHNITLSLTAPEHQAIHGFTKLLNDAQADITFTHEKSIWSILDVFFVTNHDDPDLVNRIILTRASQRFPVRKVDVSHWSQRVRAGLLPRPNQIPTIPKPKNYYQEFRFDGEGKIRVSEKGGQIWFVAKDVCDVLGIKNTKMAVDGLEQSEKDGVSITDSIGRKQRTTVINESGFYALVLRSRKQKAKQFRRWVTGEVIPAIRKTGSYSMSGEDPNVALLEESIRYAEQKDA